MTENNLTEKAQKIMDLVKELSVVELAGLVKSLEEEFWVTAAAAPVMMAWSAGSDWDWGGDSDSDLVSVELAEIWQQKIAVIKVMKEVLWLWLKEAKAIVEKAPTLVKEKISQEEADWIKAKLEEAWATVNLK